jgi:hypothetical protein
MRRDRKIARLDEAIVDNILDSIDFRSEIRDNVSEEDIIKEFRKQFEQLVKLGILTEDEYDLLEDKLIVKVREEREKFEEELKLVDFGEEMMGSGSDGVEVETEAEVPESKIY